MTKNNNSHRSHLQLILAALLTLMLGACSQEQASSTSTPELVPEQLASLPEDRKGQVLIYGAYGFTGKGITRLASEYGIKPVLAGRNGEKLRAVAEESGFDYITLSLNSHEQLVRVLKHFELVMHIAGPYTYTAKPMLDAAIETGTHYVDLTGENHVIQAQLDRHDEFVAANIMVMPAVGYDVVPTDCINFYVAEQIDDPQLLTLEMNSSYTEVEGAGASRGTIKSALEMLSRPLLFRQDGAMVAQAPKIKTRERNGATETLVQIPWADMMTSWVSTGVPTIEVYQLAQGEIPGWLPWLAQREWGKDLLNWLIDKTFPEGPPPEAQAKRQTQLIATATNAAGDSFSAEMITPEPYLLTFHSALLIARNIIEGVWDPGFQTPAPMYGADLALEIPGVSRRDL